MTPDEFLEATGLPARTLRHYRQRGLMPDARPDGSYDEEHVLRADAITRLKQEGVRALSVIAARLDGKTLEELRRFAYEDLDRSDAALDEGQNGEPPTEARRAVVRSEASPASTAHEQWTRMTLRPGLELHVRHDADDEARRLATEIGTVCGVILRSS